MMSSPKISVSLSEMSVNDNTFHAVISEIGGNSGSSVPQSVMIIGQDGAGKTTLLRRIYNSDICRLKSRVWIDGRTLFCSEDIISKAEQSEASVLFIDDMDFYLTRCSYEEQYRLRLFLYNEGAPMMISTVSKVLPALTDYEAPFFEGLKNVYIEPVLSESITRLFDKRDVSRAYRLMSLLPPTIRSIVTVHSIISQNDIPGKDISILVSMFSDKYRHYYQDLPTNSQHILNAFESGISSMTMPELRDKTGLSTNILTAYLKILGSLDIIRVDKSIKRKTKYSMRDPLFQIWLTQSAESWP